MKRADTWRHTDHVIPAVILTWMLCLKMGTAGRQRKDLVMSIGCGLV
jgi:hypothetical protein